jgi:hypothetical protein
MSRGAVGETIRVAPTNNVFTALAGAAVVLQLIAVVALFLKGAFTS